MSYKNIKDIQIGDFVQGETQINQVIDIEKPDLGSRLLYSLNDGPYFVTEEHPFKTEDGWKSINPKATYEEGSFNEVITELKEGDFIITLNGKEKIKSIKWKSANDQTVYNLILSGDHTYYADDYLVHNKTNAYEGADHRIYQMNDLIRSAVHPWNDKVKEIGVDSQETINELEREFLGAFSGETEEGEEGEATGGLIEEAQNELNAAMQDFSNKQNETKTAMLTGQKQVGQELGKAQTQLTSMIGKSNLAQANQRQKMQLNKEAVEQSQALGDQRDVAMEKAVADREKAQDKFDSEVQGLKNDYGIALRTITDGVEKETRKSEWVSAYDGDRGDLTKPHYYRHAASVWDNFGKPLSDEGGDVVTQLQHLEIDDVLDGVENPTPTNIPIDTKVIHKKDGEGWKQTIRARQSCFIGSTKILMGKVSE